MITIEHDMFWSLCPRKWGRNMIERLSWNGTAANVSWEQIIKFENMFFFETSQRQMIGVRWIIRYWFV